MKCPECGGEMTNEKAINLRNGAEIVHKHCHSCGYDTDMRWNEKRVK